MPKLNDNFHQYNFESLPPTKIEIAQTISKVTFQTRYLKGKALHYYFQLQNFYIFLV